MKLISPKIGIWAPGVLALIYSVFDFVRIRNGHPAGSWSFVTNMIPFLIIFINATTARYFTQLEERIAALERR